MPATQPTTVGRTEDLMKQNAAEARTAEVDLEAPANLYAGRLGERGMNLDRPNNMLTHRGAGRADREPT